MGIDSRAYLQLTSTRVTSNPQYKEEEEEVVAKNLARYKRVKDFYDYVSNEKYGKPLSQKGE